MIHTFITPLRSISLVPRNIKDGAFDCDVGWIAFMFTYSKPPIQRQPLRFNLKVSGTLVENMVFGELNAYHRISIGSPS